MIDFLKRITVEAGELIERSARTKAKDKGADGWATEADFASERFLVSQIQKKFPSHKILSFYYDSTLLHAWDIAAAHVIVEEARGVLFYEGGFFAPHNITAGNRWIVEQTKRILKDT